MENSVQKKRKKLAGLLAATLLITFGAAALPTATVMAEDKYIDEEYILTDTAADISSPGATRDISDQELTETGDPGSSLIGLDLPAWNPSDDFVIHLGGPIGKLNKWITADNHVILDFYNADNQLEDQYYLSHPVVERIRTGRFEGNNTRVSFDLKENALFKVYLSGDRRTVLVRFIQNNILNVDFRPEGDTDVIEITGAYPPHVVIKRVMDADEVVVDMPFSLMNLSLTWMTELKFVSSVKTEQVGDTARITLKSRSQADVKISYEGNTALVRLTPATYKNIYYSGDKTVRLRKDYNYTFQLQEIAIDDQYNANKYILTLPGDYGGWLGWGDFIINDDYLSGVTVQADGGGKTRVILNEKRVLAYNITEDNEYVYIHAVLPREKYDKIVILDPGHGGAASGAQANGLVEKDVNLDVSARLLRVIEQEGRIKAYATRTADINVDLYDRPRWANSLGDLFVSIHMNAMSGNGTANGTEVYYYPHSNDGQMGFSGSQLASILQNNLLNELGSTDRKIHSARFVVIKDTAIPSALVEVGFLTNWSEAMNLSTDAYRERAAQAIYRSIVEAFEIYRPAR
jgi:N-acetylmuramoyl-L-alanine amidase